MEQKKSSVHSVIRLIRPQHWLKNVLIFVPFVFSGKLFEFSLWPRLLACFFSFSFAASAVYVFNDIRDVETDRQHEIKKNRPIASGEVKISAAYALMGILLLLSFCLHVLGCMDVWQGFAFLLAYLLVNLTYSLGLKNVPYVDIFLLVSGFVIRVYYGATVFDGYISRWVTLTVLALSFYMSLGKRRNELIKTKNSHSTRKVLQYYTVDFLDKFMYICLAIAIVFYALWSTDEEIISRFQTDKLVWTVPLVILLVMKYSADIEADTYGDPVEVILHDKWLILLAILYAVVLLGILYLPV